MRAVGQLLVPSHVLLGEKLLAASADRALELLLAVAGLVALQVVLAGEHLAASRMSARELHGLSQPVLLPQVPIKVLQLLDGGSAMLTQIPLRTPGLSRRRVWPRRRRLRPWHAVAVSGRHRFLSGSSRRPVYRWSSRRPVRPCRGDSGFPFRLAVRIRIATQRLRDLLPSGCRFLDSAHCRFRRGPSPSPRGFAGAGLARERLV
mmetsp:Transcript_9874/g.24280  ORF Transcript_9874/g.24280 Transcript_9874/m.24280 type:complete len:205 (+) Transcript_9874:873-1487(+)